MFLLRPILAGIAIVVAVLAVVDYRDWRRGLDELTTTARELGLSERRPGLERGLERDADNDRAALRLARAILAEELDQQWISELPESERPEARRRGLERLDLAHDLGVSSLAARPSSWEAHLVIGGSSYLRLSRRRDPRLGQERDVWLGHLLEAKRLAPRQPEPLRFLAATYLGDWSVLTPAERDEATAVIAEAFRDPTSFDLLATAWMRVAPSLREALAIVPDDHRPWDKLKRYFRRQGDWERYCAAHGRFEEALGRFLERQLAEAEGLLRGGDRERAVRFFAWVGASARPDHVNTAVVERVLQRVPAGSLAEADQRWIGGWLDWTLRRCLDGPSCPLSSDSIRRLLGLARDVSPATRAWALAAAGDLAGAEAVERAELDPNAAEWTPYLLLKARLLGERGAHDEALGVLDRLPARGTTRHRQAVLDAALAAGDTARAAEERAALAAAAREEWTRRDWTIERGAARLELLPSEPAEGLEIALRPAPGDGGALTVLWDESVVGVYPATRARTVRLDLPVTARPHLLEIRPEAGARAATAAVRLRTPSP